MTIKHPDHADPRSIPTRDAVVESIAAIVNDSSLVTANEHQLRRLAQAIRNRRGRFGLFFAVCNDARRRQLLTQQLIDNLSTDRPVEFAFEGDESSLLDTLVEVPGAPEPLIVHNFELLLPSSESQRKRREQTLQELQLKREQFRKLQRPLLLWMPEYVYALIGKDAIDFWSWQSGGFFFTDRQPSDLSKIVEVRKAWDNTPPLRRVPIVDFTGREEEISRLVRALSQGDAEVAVIHGMEGVGKSELALKVVEALTPKFPDAQLFVSMQNTMRTPADGLREIVRAFEPGESLPDDAAGLTAIYRNLLRGRRALIVLDDVPNASVALPFLPPSGSALLITSRQRFNMPGEINIGLDALPVEDAINLLLKICPRIGSAATRLARFCDYLPLSLRLIAGTLTTNSGLSPSRLLRLAEKHVNGDADRSLEAVFSVSYSLLESSAREVLCRLSVFPTSFDEAAAVAIGSQEESDIESDRVIKKSIDLLINCNWLTLDHPSRRLSLHGLVRNFVADRLKDEEAVRLRHAEYYSEIAAHADELYRMGGESLRAALGLFDVERLNIDSAWNWASAQAGASLSAIFDNLVLLFARSTIYVGAIRYDMRGERIPQLETAVSAARRLKLKHEEVHFLGLLGEAWSYIGEFQFASTRYEQALMIAREINARAVEGNILDNLGSLYFHSGDSTRAHNYYMRALQIARKAGDMRILGSVLTNLGRLYSYRGELREAIKFYEEASLIARRLGDLRMESAVLGDLGLAYSYAGDARGAISLYEQALETARELGDRHSECRLLDYLGSAYASLRELQQAVALYENALRIAYSLGDRQSEGRLLANLGQVHSILGEEQKAIGCYEHALAIAREIGQRRGEADILGNMGVAYAGLGDFRRAIELYQEGLRIARESGDRRSEGRMLSNLGKFYARAGDAQRAIELYKEALAIVRGLGDRSIEARINWNWGTLLVEQGEAKKALDLMQAAVDFEREIGHPDAEQDEAVLRKLRETVAL